MPAVALALLNAVALLNEQPGDRECCRARGCSDADDRLGLGLGGRYRLAPGPAQQVHAGEQGPEQEEEQGGDGFAAEEAAVDDRMTSP